MGELSESLCTTRTIALGGKEIVVSKITMGIWADFENAAELRAGLLYRNLSIEEKVNLPIEFLQTTTGRLTLLALCINKGKKSEEWITPSALGDSLPLANITDVITAVTELMDESQPVKLPGEDDGPGNPEGTAGA